MNVTENETVSQIVNQIENEIEPNPTEALNLIETENLTETEILR